MSTHFTQLAIEVWAQAEYMDENRQVLSIGTGPLPAVMPGSPATGRGLVSNGRIGVDMIRLAAGTGFAPHTHTGDHVLIVLAGEGTITYGGLIHGTHAGQTYLIPGSEVHAVTALTDHVILAIGSPHIGVEEAERMTLREYDAIQTEFGELVCLICGLTGVRSGDLSEMGCPHDPGLIKRH